MDRQPHFDRGTESVEVWMTTKNCILQNEQIKTRQEIPQWTWYNGQFLFQFDEELKKNPDKTIAQFFSDFLAKEGIKNLGFYHTKNQGVAILLLYGLLVIPKEIWEKSSTNFQFTTRGKFSIKPPTEINLSSLKFLQLLRNSLAHANFSIDISSSRLTFWNNRNEIKNFEVEISFADLGEFLSEIGKYYVNEVKMYDSEQNTDNDVAK